MASSDPINLLWITDIHLSDRAPGRRSEKYREQIFDKLRFVGETAHKLNAKVLVGGDVFHIKNPRSAANSPSLIREAVEVFSEYPDGCVYGCVGNHDIQFDRMDTLPDQPLGILVEAGVYKLLDQNSLHIPFHNGSISIEAFGYQEQDQIMAALKASGKRKQEVEYRIAIVHASACSGDTKELFGSTIIGYNQLRNLDFDLMLWGHDHSRIPTETCGNVTHVNLGSLSRAALSEDETERPVVAVLLSFTEEGCNIKEIQIPVVPLAQAFRIEDRHVIGAIKNAALKEFFSDLSSSVDKIESSDPIEVLETLCKEDKALLKHIKEVCEL